MISKGLLKGGTVSVKLCPDKEFKFEVKKGRKGSVVSEEVFENTAVSK